MRNVNRQQVGEVQYKQSVRQHPVTVLTSLPAGRVVALAAIPMFREDSLRGRHRVTVEMLETAEILMNGVNLRVMAYCVPYLALERFEQSRDQLDRSYMGEPQVEGGSVVDFIETHAMGTHGSNEVYKYLGLHGKSTDQVNTAYLEAYNCIWNYRAKNRSRDLTPRARLATTLAPAFWLNSPFEHVLPNFDQAVIDGEVALSYADTNRVPIRGMGTVTPALTGTTTYVSNFTAVATDPPDNTIYPLVGLRSSDPLLPAIYAELADGGIKVSLSNLELAKTTQAFAKIRERYEGIDEEHIIDMLMAGLSIPDQALKQPILLADVRTTFAQAKRHAMDGGNLAESAVSGVASVEFSLRVPTLNTGGVVMILAEIMPDQVFERQRDPVFHSSEVEEWPEALRDTLDPEKVDVILNADVDTDHASPTGAFGYEPKNAKFNRPRVAIGGKFYRPTTNTGTDTDRQRLWSAETVNPVLGTDFYLTTTLHVKPFLDLAVDNFEAVVVGNNMIVGNSVFGGVLTEATSPTESNYDKVMEKAPVDRIEQV